MRENGGIPAGMPLERSAPLGPGRVSNQKPPGALPGGTTALAQRPSNRPFDL